MEVYWYTDLFLNPEDSDFEAHVETRNESKLVFPVHRFILERESEVFKTMLEKNKFKEGMTKVIEMEIPGDEEDAIIFLRYLYTRKLGNLDLRSYVVLMQVAHFYQVKNLFQICEKRLKNTVTPFSVCRVYWSLEKIATEGFLLFCKSIMLKYAFIIFMENLHTILPEDAMKFLLESDELILLNEEQALCALWVWGRTYSFFETKTTKGTLKKAIEKLLPLIRWHKIKNAIDAPWFYLIEENKQNTVTVGNSRESNHNISLKEFSKILGCVNFEDDFSLKHLRRRFESQDFWTFDCLFNSQNSDFEVHVEMNGNENMLVIPIHGFVLKYVSEVFTAMMQEEKFNEGITKVLHIKIPGDEECVESSFRYLYTKKLGDLDIRSYITLMQVAHLYEIKSLLELCEKRIVDALTPFSVCRVYCYLEKIASENTLTFCKNIMLRFAFILFTENSHLVLKEETMKLLLESDELNLMDEEQALSALWCWARTKCLLESSMSKEIVRETFENLLYLIRWPMINNTESDAPWVNLVRSNKHLIGNDIKGRMSSIDISLTEYSNVLVFSESDDINNPVLINSQKEMVHIDVSSNVLLTGLTIILKYYRLSAFNLLVNNNNITSNIRRNNHIITYEINNKECWSVSRMTLEFTKPILLSCLYSNKIIISAGCNVILPTYSGFPNKKIINSDSGRVLNVEIRGDVTGIQKINYITWK